MTFARALAGLGEGDAARTELEQAREIFAGMDARAFVTEIDDELRRSSAGAGVTGPR